MKPLVDDSNIADLDQPTSRRVVGARSRLSREGAARERVRRDHDVPFSDTLPVMAYRE
jgi:hypothetical protein